MEKILERQDEPFDKVQKEDIISTIPTEHYKRPVYANRDEYIEWRWRFYNIDGNSFTEISKMNPNQPRVYLDKRTTKWIPCQDIKKYKKYITDEYYYYTKSE